MCLTDALTVNRVSPAFRGGSGPPLVLLHAGWTCWRLWAPVLPWLQERYDVFAPTLPGHHGGPAMDFGVPATMGTLVDRVEELLDHQRIERPIVIGNSIGGWAAMELGRRGRASSVVAIGPMGMQDQASAIKLERYFTRVHVAARAGRPLAPFALRSALARRLILRDLCTRGDRVPYDVARDLIDAFVGCDVAGLFNAVRSPDGAMPNFDAAHEVDVPVLLLWGDRDWVATLADMRRYLDVLPNARLVELPGTGHCPQVEAPDRVLAEIERFLAHVDDQPRPAGAGP